MLPNIGIAHEEQAKILEGFDKAFSDNSIDFSEQLKRYYKSQFQMVEKYGRDGFMLLLDSETRVYVDSNTKRSLEIMHYSEMPESSPWYNLRDLPLDEAIEQIWEPFRIGLVDTLIEYVPDLFAIFEDGKWFLVYPYKVKDYANNEYYEFLGGREPEPNVKLPKALAKAGWKMPEDLLEFYGVHGTFGDVKAVLRNDDTHAIAAASTLEASLAFLEEKREEWEVGYSFFDLLPFFEDGAGNSQNFYKADPVGNTYITVDWDHETKEISGGVMLEEFIDYYFGEKLNGEY